MNGCVKTLQARTRLLANVSKWEALLGRESVQTAAVEKPQPPLAVAKCHLILVEFSRDRKNWTIKHRSMRCSASRLFLKPVSLRFTVLVIDPSNESMREIINVTRDASEAVPLSYEQPAPIELVTRPGWDERFLEKPQKSRQSKRWSSKSWTSLFLRNVFLRRMWSR